MIILGIDPGTASTGYGVVRQIKANNKNGMVLECLAYGLIRTFPTMLRGDRLKLLNNELNKIIKKYQPETMAVERLYFFKNLKTALPVSQAEGVILLTAAKKKIPVRQFTPLQVKMTVTGYGRAEKKEVQNKVKSILKLKEIPKPDDAADALAIAMTCFLTKEA